MISKKELKKLQRNLVADPDDFISSFRKNLFMYVDQKDITLAEIAEAADVSFSTLRSFLYGDAEDCRLSTAVKIARALGVSVDELIGCGTITPQTCESLQLVRQLPESFTHFVRWAIHYHYNKLTTNQVTEKAIEVMKVVCCDNGNMKMTNDLDVIDISGLNDDLRPKIFIGVKMPCNHYEPKYFKGDILLLANDRSPKPSEDVIVGVGNNMWILNRRDEKIDGVQHMGYYSIRDGRKCADDKTVNMVIGYVVKVIQADSEED